MVFRIPSPYSNSAKALMLKFSLLILLRSLLATEVSLLGLLCVNGKSLQLSIAQLEDELGEPFQQAKHSLDL